MTRRAVLSLILSFLLVAVLEGPPARSSPVHSAVSVSPASARMIASCTAPLTLTLEPGQNWPGSQSAPIPSDIPPGPLTVELPLYPGAVPTLQQEAYPAISYPLDLYMKSASAMFQAQADPDVVVSWYQDAFAGCGYSLQGTQSGPGIVHPSQGITETGQVGGIKLWIALSFASAPDGGTLILYVAIALTPPRYPVPGSILRVPGTPVAVSITQYSGMNPGPRGLRPLRSVDVRDTATAASLGDEINHLPKVTGVTISCPMDDGSHDTLVFRDADGSTHPVHIGLRGCQMVTAPPAPAGRLWDDRRLLPRINALLHGPGGRSHPYPYDARNLRPVRVRQLGSLPGRFLSTGQNGSHLLYLSRGSLFMTPATGGSPLLLAKGISDASFTINDQYALARPLRSPDLTRLLLIDTHTGKTEPFHLPGGVVLVGRVAGNGAPGLADAMACDLQYVYFLDGRRVGGIDPAHPTHDRFRSAPYLPPRARGQRIAVSCSGVQIAVYQPGKGLVIRYVGHVDDGGGQPVHRLAIGGLTFLSWAPDDRHLAYRTGDTLFVLDVSSGEIRPLMRIGRDVIRGAAWDPWSHLIALSITPPGAHASNSRIVLANTDGTITGRLPLPFRGATRLDWSVWAGETIGVTRVTARGTQAWAVSLPALPPDPGMFSGG